MNVKKKRLCLFVAVCMCFFMAVCCYADNAACVITCLNDYNNCLRRGVDPEICQGIKDACTKNCPDE